MPLQHLLMHTGTRQQTSDCSSRADREAQHAGDLAGRVATFGSPGRERALTIVRSGGGLTKV